MILPSTYLTVLLLLIASTVCLGLWINTFKATGPKWRFELFSMDFGAGAVIAVVIAAYTLGTLGSDLGFSDRLLVAGRTDQVLAILAGAVFNLGNMLLLAAVSQIGIAGAVPLSVGVALIVNSGFNFRPHNRWYLITGIVLVLVTILFELRAARLREAALQPKKVAAPATPAETVSSSGAATATAATTASVTANPAKAPLKSSSGQHHRTEKKRLPKKKYPRRPVRGVTAAMISGIALGFFIVVLQNCMPGEFGLGPYAAMLLFGVGVLGSTIVYNFYFLNMTIEGAPLTFGSYFDGNLTQHLLGIFGGVVCAGGLLAASIAINSAGAVDMPLLLQILIPVLSVVLAFLSGAAFWKEMRVPAGSKTALFAGLALFLCSLGLFAFGFTIK